MRTQTKTCTACGQTKPLKEFYRSAGARYGRYSCCKDCARERARENYRKRRAAR